ncbi:MAG: hypothetical protein ACD_63C00084G0002 [uncultured bacterium]|nr:MAG: hypothetical protein ACD_63C00084G0002 [uncultured bacterium]
MKNKIFRALIVLIVPLFFLGAGFLPGCDRSVDGGLFTTRDGGNTWEQKVFVSEKENIAKLNVFSIVIHPTEPNVIYLGTQGKGVYKSSDSGGSFKRVLLNDVDIYSIAIDPKDSNIVYASSLSAANGKIYRSPNGFEETVEEILIEAREGQALKDVVVDPYDDSRIYAVSQQGGVFKSADFGASWSVKKWFDAALTKIAVSQSDTRVIYVASSDGGIFKTSDGGDTWLDFREEELPAVSEDEELKEGLLYSFPGANVVNDIAVDPGNSDMVYAATDYGLLKSVDGGRFWKTVNSLVAPGTVPIKTVDLASESSNVIYISAGSSLHKSTDGGINWSNWLLPTVRRIEAVAIDPKDMQIVYVGVMKLK